MCFPQQSNMAFARSGNLPINVQPSRTISPGPAVGSELAGANIGALRGNSFRDQVKKFGQDFLAFQQNYQPQVTDPSFVLQPQQMNDPQDPGAELRAQILAQLLGGGGRF